MFEVLTAVTFLLFARVPAELCVLEVGLGGRADATNVVPRPAACAIASISLDHREMLGDTLALIAREKAGIIKPGVPVATGAQEAEVQAVLDAVARAAGARLLARGPDWTVEPTATGLHFTDAAGTVDLPRPALPGRHQFDNAGLAVATIRAAALGVSDAAIARGIGSAQWPARMQRLHGALAGLLPAGWEVWLDGGHNPGAGVILADQVRDWADRPVDVVVGMKQAKDSASSCARCCRWPAASGRWPNRGSTLPCRWKPSWPPRAAWPAPARRSRRRWLGWPARAPGRVLICGSLYLAGEVLKLDDPAGPR